MIFFERKAFFKLLCKSLFSLMLIFSGRSGGLTQQELPQIPPIIVGNESAVPEKSAERLECIFNGGKSARERYNELMYGENGLAYEPDDQLVWGRSDLTIGSLKLLFKGMFLAEELQGVKCEKKLHVREAKKSLERTPYGTVIGLAAGIFVGIGLFLANGGGLGSILLSAAIGAGVVAFIALLASAYHGFLALKYHLEQRKIEKEIKTIVGESNNFE